MSASNEWRWLCVACGTEGRRDQPKLCPTCGSSDSWYMNNAHANDPRSMREIMDHVILGRLKKPTKQ